MAIMIPEKPKDFEELSLEGIMFEALQKLPNTYYVFHSFKIVSVKEGIIKESETDFVVFNKDKGFLCLEAKAGGVYCCNGIWYYHSGKEIAHNGPYNQAARNMWDLRSLIEDSNYPDIINRCKFLHAVWFPSINEGDLKASEVPPETDLRLTMFKSALYEPQKYIDRIFDIDVTRSRNVKTKLTDNEVKYLVEHVLCPSFDVFPTSSLELDISKVVFHRMLSEQANILNYLEEQKTAAISGAAGTGKTMIAVEKAKRNAQKGEKVLFLCYNAYLKDYLQDNYSNENIDFFTADGFACKTCKTYKADYSRLKRDLEDKFYSGSFPYKHVVIDEGQDFGREEMEQFSLLNTLKDIVTDESIDGTFYIFYDKYQLVQGERVPEYISDADCKLTLYKNCRNTENIAITSLRPINDRKPKLAEGSLKGTAPILYFNEDLHSADKAVASIISDLKSEGINDIVILTAHTEEESELSQYCKDGLFKNKYRFTTCRKFKGLEADAIILTDIDEYSFEEDNALLFYVGTSRARFKLCLLTNMDDEECAMALESLNKESKRRPKKELATALNATYSKISI